ncbi:hypothetical protein SAMN04488526_0140 [Jannaschia helgolandensis]|uniref:Uncharacterized protein n=1 Tax=Jannaschia helgolandensis TaxID=188906 RepID=A0A1H7FME7_9RHOB|nr:hypothetical protein SAMN04488526_0140 [Jannaschia helgolandensis]
MNWVEVTEIGRNLVLTLAALFGAYTAYRGVRSWRDEKNWMRNTELAESLLILLYERNDAVQHIRYHPVLYTLAKKDDFDEPIKGEQKQEYFGVRKYYSDRIDRLENVKSRMYPLEIRASVQWGRDCLKSLETLRCLEGQLLSEIDNFLESKQPNADGPDSHKNRDIHPDTLSTIQSHPLRDAFRDSYHESLKLIEEELRSILKRYTK